nr:trypsin-like serine protease [Sulfitobacter algicola]
MPAAIVPYEEGLESVFYPDDREEVTETETYPASATVLITSSNLGRCTGWVVAERTLVTAGHCVHEGGAGGSWAEDVRVYAGRNGSVSPFGSCAVSHMFSVEGWVVERDKNYDYGVLIADCELVSVTGAFGLADPDQEWLESAIEVTGYPVDKPLTQWAAEDKVTLVYELKLFHRADTMSGMSGSAVHTGDLFVFAVHTNARHNGAPWRSNNAATRLTEARLSNIAHWIDFEGND